MKKGCSDFMVDQPYGYNKSPPQNCYRKENPDTVQWIPLNDPNKQDQSQSIGYGEITTYQREQVYNWYHTVPLRHEGYMENANQRDPIQEQINKKGRLLSERQKRYRTSFTMFQLNRLEEEFQKDMYAVGMKRMRLAGELNLSEKQVKVWFQNRRMKYKRICQRLHNRRMAGHKFWQ